MNGNSISEMTFDLLTNHRKVRKKNTFNQNNKQVEKKHNKIHKNTSPTVAVLENNIKLFLNHIEIYTKEQVDCVLNTMLSTSIEIIKSNTHSIGPDTLQKIHKLNNLQEPISVFHNSPGTKNIRINRNNKNIAYK